MANKHNNKGSGVYIAFHAINGQKYSTMCEEVENAISMSFPKNTHRFVYGNEGVGEIIHYIHAPSPDDPIKSASFFTSINNVMKDCGELLPHFTHYTEG